MGMDARFLLAICLLISSSCGFQFMRDSLLGSRRFLHSVHPAQEDWNALPSFSSAEVYTNKGNNIKQKRTDNRNALPYVVLAPLSDVRKDSSSGSSSAADRTDLIQVGTFMLDPTTACGDYLDLGNGRLFRINRVIFLYKYKEGSYEVFKKKLEVSAANIPWLSSTSPRDIDPDVNMEGYVGDDVLQ